MATLVSRTEKTASVLASRMSQAASEVDPTTDAVPVDGGDDRHRAVGHRVTEAWRRRISAPRRPGPGCHRRWRAVVGAGRSGQAGHGHQVQSDARSGAPGPPPPPPGPRGRRRWRPWPRGRSDQNGRADRIALLRPVEPQGGHVPVDLDGEDLGGERVDGVSGWRGHAQSVRRRPAGASRPPRRTGPGRAPESGQVVWTSRLGTRASLRERPSALSIFTPETAAALPGPPWLQRRRAAAAEAFSSLRLPTEKDEVWRYSRIDQLDLDRFRPAGTGPSIRTTTRALRPRTGSIP